METEAGAEAGPTRLRGGELPDVGRLFQETMTDFTENLGPYALAGLGMFMVVVPVTFVGVFVVYFLVFGGMFAVMLGGALFAVAVAETLGDTAGGIALVLVQILSIAVPFVLLFLAIFGLTAVLAPVGASTMRAVAAFQRGEGELDLMSPFSTVTRDLVPVLIAASIVGALTTVGAMLCVVPALLVPVFFGFATSLVALHGLGGVQGVRVAGQHAVTHLSWHLPFALLYMVVMMVASYVPVVGAMFAVAFHVRAYRHVFGDDPEPQLIVA